MEPLLILVAVLVIAAIAFVVMKKQSKDGNKRAVGKRPRKGVKQAASSEPEDSYRATRIVPGANACQAANNLQGKMFLDKALETPNLPLPDCTQASNCRCRYERRPDRRSGEDDRRFHSLATDLYPAASKGDERRRPKRGRRSTDR